MEFITEKTWNNKQAATIIGVSFILMLFLGSFSEFAVRVRLIQWGNPIDTYKNLRNAQSLFSAGIVAWFVIVLLDVLVAVAFYSLLRATDKSMAGLMVCLRLLYVAIKGSALIGLTLAREVVARDVDSNLIESQAHQIMQFLMAHRNGFAVALFFFGVHLVLLALLLRKVGTFPTILGWFLGAGGIGYCLNSLTTLFWSEGEQIGLVIIIFVIPMTFSELSVGLWLWAKWNKIPGNYRDGG